MRASPCGNAASSSRCSRVERISQATPNSPATGYSSERSRLRSYFAPAIVSLTVGDSASPGIRYGIAGLAVVIIIAAVVVSKRRESSLHADAPARA